ncbi:MAG: Hsp20 family protein, partial [Treponema sp.]|nr:Hsp20 family protein [Treponema sp.]
ISAAKSLNKDEKEQKSGKLIRQERYSGSMARSFYVGEEMTEEDVKAKFEDGVLKLVIPKKEAKKAVGEHKTIAIEG